MKRHPSQLTWFKYQARDLHVFAWFAFRIHVATCKTCGERFRHEESERATVEALLDGSRRAVSRRAASWMALAMPAMALAALVLVFAFRRSSEVPAGTGPEETMRTKGDPTSSFIVYVRGDGGATVLGEACRPGEALQAQYRSDKPYMLVVGVDASREARVLAPLDAAASGRIGNGLESVPQSWVLDAARGRERFVAFFSDVPVDAAGARAAALEPVPRLEGATVVVRECTKASP